MHEITPRPEPRVIDAGGLQALIDLLRQHPDLRPEEVYAALTYFYDHRDAMVAEMKRCMTAADDGRQAQPFSRQELLRRNAVEGS